MANRLGSLQIFRACVGLTAAFLGALPTRADPLTPTTGKFTGVRSWKSLRDAYVVRQWHDYSCGASSIATLLTFHFAKPTTEDEVLAKLPAITRPYSLSDMQTALHALGYDAIALRAAYSALETLDRPAIVYLHPRRTRTTVGHFVVLRSVGPDNVVVADPAIGTRVYSKSEFLEKWLGKKDPKSSTGIFMLARPTEESEETSLQNNRAITPHIQHQFFWKGGYRSRVLLHELPIITR